MYAKWNFAVKLDSVLTSWTDMSDTECSDYDQDSVFTDAASGTGTDTTKRHSRTKRQLSVSEMARNLERKRQKNIKRPGDDKSPRQRKEADSARAGVTLEAIKDLIEKGNNHVIQVLERKFESMERRLEALESEVFDKDRVINDLTKECQQRKEENEELRQRLDGIDRNRRLSSLILTCRAFGTRTQGEDVVPRVVEVLNSRLPGLRLKSEDIQVAHRLETDSKVIVKFLRRSVRDAVYERRFELFPKRDVAERFAAGRGGVAAQSQMAPLYINESLVPDMQRIYQLLLAARSSANGSKIASVFTRRGLVYCRKTPGGVNILVKSQHHLQDLLGGKLPQLPDRRREQHSGREGGQRYVPRRDAGPRPAVSRPGGRQLSPASTTTGIRHPSETTEDPRSERGAGPTLGDRTRTAGEQADARLCAAMDTGAGNAGGATSSKNKGK